MIYYHVLEEYNFKTIHSTIQITPSDARILENQNKLQQRYKSIYDEYNPHNNRTESSNLNILKVGDNVCKSAYKGIFDI